MADQASNRARTRAIRARMAHTGESWTAAARRHDAEHANNADPVLAERDWHTRARVRITTGSTAGAVEPAVSRTFSVGDELTMLQWGRGGREIDRDSWWTSTDIDGAHILDADRIEVLEILEEDPPTYAAAALPAARVAELLGPAAATWLDQGILVISARRSLEVRASDGELLGLVDVDRDRQPTQPITYRAVIVPGEYPRSVPMPSGFVPDRPARAADAERIRWRSIPGVVAPETMRP